MCPRRFASCVYGVCMARLNIYVPDALAAAAKEAGLNVSAVTQEAVRASLRVRSTDTWLATLTHCAHSSNALSHERAIEALDAVRDEPSTRHG